jgi:AraC-like DNA-binding protein
VSIQRFSTADIPEPLRREVSEAVYSAHVPGAIDFVPDVSFGAELSMRALDGMHLAMMDVSPVRFVTPRDDRGVLYLGMTLSGGGRLADGRQQETRAVRGGDICAMRCEDGYVAHADRPSRFVNFAIPYGRILPGLADPGRAVPSLSMDHPAARLLHGYATTLLGHEGALAEAEQTLYAAHIADLVALLLGPTRDAAEQARTGGARAARRLAVQADVRSNLRNPELSVDWLARRHGISPSYVRSLFYDDGTSFTDFVTEARLARVAAALRDPATAGRTVAALALAAGFGDVSWFNQLFRRRFGMTPSAMRAEAPGPDGTSVKP